jgi:hypothetical protein
MRERYLFGIGVLSFGLVLIRTCLAKTRIR